MTTQQKPTDTRLLFVYGTLCDRVNGDAIRWRGGTLLGEATISGVMYDLGSFPAVVPHPWGHIHGEVISYEDYTDADWSDALRKLDQYEGVPHLYYRDVVEATLLDGTVVTAWVYFYTDATFQRKESKDASIIPCGDWLEAYTRPANAKPALTEGVN